MIMNGHDGKAFGVKVSVHQGSVLSQLLFGIVLEVLSRKFMEGLPMELLYADYLVMMAAAWKVRRCVWSTAERSLFFFLLKR